MANRFLNAKEVAEIAGKKESWGYTIIRELNEELAKQGYITARGRIPEAYFRDRMGLNIGSEAQ